MKREIKFRAKTIKDSITSEFWVYGDYVQNFCFDAHNDTICAICFNNDYWRVDPKTVGQYTGLKDKNEKEIYEGDIINSITLCKQLWNENDFQNYEVRFEYGTFCFFDANGIKSKQWNDGSQEWYSIENNESFDIKVIGNIHDSPELLKQ